MHEPRLTRVERGGCAYWTDEVLRSRSGIIVAFSERTGGVSTTPYASLNLAAHVGDEPRNVDENRARFLSAVGLASLRESLITAEQVHGSRVALVDRADAGRGAWAQGRKPRVEETDALLTGERGLPLMLFFADCVPVVVVALTSSRAAVCVAHGGWRSVREGIVTASARALSQVTGCDPCNVLAYIGPHICAKDYEVGPDVLSQFSSEFATVSRAGTGALDLGAAISEGLVDAGVPMSAQCSLGVCTAEHTDRFFSYRAQGLTGRHAALAAMTGLEG